MLTAIERVTQKDLQGNMEGPYNWQEKTLPDEGSGNQ